MKRTVRYYAKTGNPKRLAAAVAAALGVEALPISEPVDILFLGNSYYAFNLNSTRKKVKAEADRAGIPKVEREFHCRRECKGIHKGRPNAEDLAAAAAFARALIAS